MEILRRRYPFKESQRLRRLKRAEKESPATRERLLEVLRSLGHHAPIDEVNLEARDAPAELSGYGSPTILIDGVEIEGGDAGTNGGCRLYRDARGRLTGVPSEAAMVAALMHAQRQSLG